MKKSKKTLSRMALDIGRGNLPPIIDLRNAIIWQAVDDWKRLCSRKYKRGAYMEHGSFIEIAQFFENDCYGLLIDTEIEGKDILDRLYLVPGAPKHNKTH